MNFNNTNISFIGFKYEKLRPIINMTWTKEYTQNISMYHNIDAEAELTVLLSEQIAAEIDREIIRSIIEKAD